jgi:hypothetical protein
VADRDVPTKTITGPDGHPIHYLNLPNVGEPYHKPDVAGHDAVAQQPTITAAHAPPTVTASESWRERVMSAARSALERVGVYGQAAVNALVVDDWKALTDAHSSTLQRVEAAADLASWAIPEGKIAEIAGHAVVKASEIAAAHLSAAGLEHTGAAAAAIAASRGLSRPLTDAERSGHFRSADDFKKFMGPATEHGGPERDWHHIVEKHHADGTRQFAPERVHSIENMVPVPRAAHQGVGGLTAEFKAKDEFLGTSLRERLQGKPWDKHVDNGEQALRDRGFDPDHLRAETRTRFEQRLLEHDRGHAVSREHGTPHIAGPAVLGISGQESDSRNGETHSQATRPQSPNAWSPEMSAADFAKLQARVRGGDGWRGDAAQIHIERDGRLDVVRPATHFTGTIESIDGDRITQHVGRGHTVTWSRAELGEHFNDQKAFDAAMQPGHMMNIGIGRNGVVDAQQQVPGHGWESLNSQPLPPWQQTQALTLGHGR